MFVFEHICFWFVIISSSNECHVNQVANSHIGEWMSSLGYAQPNLTFKKGYIEDLIGSGVQPESIDIAISNCVVNLSPDKEAVLRGIYSITLIMNDFCCEFIDVCGICVSGVYNALKVGGEFHFSDVYADRRLSEAARSHHVLVGECLGTFYIFKSAICCILLKVLAWH
jgi:hypothetical protein